MPDYVPQDWVDDDGSGTTGTPVTKARMDYIEGGIRDRSLEAPWRPVAGTLSTNVNVAGAPGPTVTVDGGYVIDGNFDPNTRILLLGQTDPVENGIWLYVYSGFSGVSSWERAVDASLPDQFIQGREVLVLNGTYADQRFTYMGYSGAVPGTDPLDFHPPVGSAASIAFRGQRTTDVGPMVAGWNGPVGFDEVFDTAQAYTGTRFTAPVSGYYEFTTNYTGSGFTGGVLIECAIIKNGNMANAVASDLTVVRSDGWMGTRASSGPIFLVAGDYVESFFYTPSAGGTLRGTSNERTLFAGNLIGVTVGVLPEPWHQVGATGQPAFQNGWVNFDSGANAQVAFYKDPHGVVRLKGLAKNGTVSSTIFNLPAGYRPATDLRFTTINNGVPSYSVVGANGNVYTNGSNVFIDLASISFRAEA